LTPSWRYSSGTMKKKKPTITPEMRARWDEGQRILSEQLAKLEKRIAERDAARRTAES